MIQTDQNAVLFSFFGPPVLLASSTRSIPESQRGRFLSGCGLDQARLVTVQQVHKDRVLVVREGSVPDPETEADGLLTASPNFILAVKTADCIPIFLWDPERRAGGVVHAGWRGLESRILPKALQEMKQAFGSASHIVRVAFGPCIRACCYEVGPEFEARFPDFYHAPAGMGKGKMNLVACAAVQALESGVRAPNLFDSAICNACENGAFFSVRREPGTAERILSVFSLRAGGL